MRLCALVGMGIALGTATAAAQTCQDVRFAPGTSGAEINGLAPTEAVLCYQMRTGAGQSATLRVVEGSNVVFTVEGVADARDELQFTTEAGTYRIFVAQLARAVDAQPFRLAINVSGRADTSTRSAVEAGRWELQETERGAEARFTVPGSGGWERAAVSCSVNRPPEFLYEKAGETALPRTDGSLTPVVAEIVVQGSARRHPLTLVGRHAQDSYWESFEPLTGAFLQDFAAGSSIRLVTENGTQVFTAGLSGTSRAVATMRRRCGI